MFVLVLGWLAQHRKGFLRVVFVTGLLQQGPDGFLQSFPLGGDAG